MTCNTAIRFHLRSSNSSSSTKTADALPLLEYLVQYSRFEIAFTGEHGETDSQTQTEIMARNSKFHHTHTHSIQGRGEYRSALVSGERSWDSGA